MGNRWWAKISIRWTLTAAVSMLLAAGPALADFCDDYAAEAVADAARAKAMSCAAGDPGPDFSGPRWDASYSDHANWCRANQGQTAASGGQSLPSAETNARLSLLTHCAICNDYAKQAIAQVQAAIKLKCNFTGVEWDNTIAGQMRSCYAQGVNWVSFDPQQISDRDAKLRVCRRAHPTLQNRDLDLRSGEGTVVKGRSRQPCATGDCSSAASSSQSSASKTSSSRAVAPGLLEGDSGFATQGPAPGGSRTGGSR